ncbi:hypothetical protein [Nostoc sp.]
MTDEKALRSLLEAVANAKVTPDIGLDALESLSYKAAGEFIDIIRHN